jgi:O-antigen ligase
MSLLLTRGSAGGARSAAVVTASIVIPLALVAAYGAITLAGTKTGMALALAATLGPIAAFFALSAPLLFPYCLFILLVPFDFLLAFAGSATLTRMVGAFCAGSLLVWFLLHRRYMTPDRAVAGWIPFIAWALCSLIWAIEPADGGAYLFTLVQLFGLYLLVSLMPVELPTLRFIVGTVILSGVIASLYGIYLFHNGIGVSTNGRLFMGKGIADLGGQIDPNHFGASLLLPIALSIVAAVEGRGGWTRIVALVATLILGGGIAVAASRGSMLGIVAILIYLLARSRKRIVVAGAALAGLGVALASYSNVLDRFSGAIDSGGAGRLDIWRVGWHAFLAHPLAGAGFGNFQLAYNDSFLSVFSPKNPYWSQAPHSILVSAAVELGVVGLALFLYGWYTQFRTMRTIAPGEPLFTLRTAVEAGVVGLFVASLFLDTFETKYLWLAFMLMMLTRNTAATMKRATARRTPA